MNVSSDEITRQIFSLSEKIDAPKEFLPIEYIQGKEGIFFDVDSYGKIHFVSTIKDSYGTMKEERMSTYDQDTFLFWTFRQITLLMGALYQSSHQKTKEDPRRLIFDKQKELLGRLKYTWRMQIQDEQDKLIKEYPFTDKIDDHCNHMDINYIRVCNISASDLKSVLTDYLHLYFHNQDEKPVLTIYGESSFQHIAILDKSMSLYRILQLTHFLSLSGAGRTPCAYLTLESREERERVAIFSQEGDSVYDFIYLQIGIDTFKISIGATDPNTQIKLVKDPSSGRYTISPVFPKAKIRTEISSKDKIDNYSITNPIQVTV
ncbi:MAG: Imm63 family immunity protein [Paludibacteraceae bacterium]